MALTSQEEIELEELELLELEELETTGLPEIPAITPEPEIPKPSKGVAETLLPSTLSAEKEEKFQSGQQSKKDELEQITLKAKFEERELTPEEFTRAFQLRSETEGKRGRKAASIFEDVTGFLERTLGATVEGIKSVSLKKFVDELGNPNASITKNLKKAVSESDQPLAAKIVEQIGLGVVSDPLSIISGIKSLLNIPKAVAKTGRQQVKRAAKEGLEVEPDVIARTEELAPPGAQVKEKITGLEVTPGEKRLITGEPDTKLLAKEAQLRKEFPGAVEGIAKERAPFLSEKVRVVADKTGLTDLLSGSKNLAGEVRTNFDGAIKKFTKETTQEFNAIKDVAKGTSVDAQDLADARAAFGDIEIAGIKIATPKTVTGRSASELTPQEISQIVQKPGGFESLKSNALFDADGNVLKRTAKGAFKRDVDDLGINKDVLEKIEKFESVLDGFENVIGGEPGRTFEQLKILRTGLFTASKRGQNSSLILGKLRDQYTELMKRQLQKVGGDELVKRFVDNDAAFSLDNKTFKSLKQSFYKEGLDDGKDVLKLREPEDILERITKGPAAGKKMEQLKQVLPEESFNTIQNAYFNKIIEEGMEGGVLNAKKFIKAVEKRRNDVDVWNNIFSQQNKDALADLIQDAVIIDKLSKFKIPAAQATGFQRLKKSLDPVLRYAFAFRSPTRFAATKIGESVVEGTLKRFRQKRAVDFFREVEPVNLITPLQLGAGLVGSTVGLQTARTVGRLPEEQIPR